MSQTAEDRGEHADTYGPRVTFAPDAYAAAADVLLHLANVRGYIVAITTNDGAIVEGVSLERVTWQYGTPYLYGRLDLGTGVPVSWPLDMIVEVRVS